ncbi:MAG: ABC transporter substrate-binding protein [Deltaproteobacteria bacterium]|nr:ABC transporter substrate-binding protein [Deltaproteobacteria bacterium]
MKLRQAAILRILALASAGTFFLVGCGAILGIEDRKKAPEGRCEGTIQLRILGDQSSNISEIGIPATAGVIDYLELLNDNGGIRGCQIDYEYVDGGNDTGKSNSIYSSWKLSAEWSQVSAIFTLGNVSLKAIGPTASNDNQVVVGIANNGDCAAPSSKTYSVTVPSLDNTFNLTSITNTLGSNGYPYVFFQPTDSSSAARIAMNYIAEQSGKRVGFFACSNDLCSIPTKAAKVQIANEISGVAIGRDLVLSLDGNQTDYNTIIYDYLEAEVVHKDTVADYQMVDWIWIGNTRKTAQLAINAINNAIEAIRVETHNHDVLNFDVKIIANNWSFDERFIITALNNSLNNRSRLHGIQSMPFYHDTSVTGMTIVEEAMAAKRQWSSFKPAGLSNSDYEVIEYVYGVTAVMAWKLAAERLIDSLGSVTPEQVKGEALKNSFESFNEVYLEGLTASPITYTSSDHRPQATVAIYYIGNDNKQKIDDSLPLVLKDEWLGW